MIKHLIKALQTIYYSQSGMDNGAKKKYSASNVD